MADFVKKEKYEGVWNGKEVKFNREWGGHRFTDAECEALLRGEKLTVTCTSGKTGEPYNVIGELADLEFNGNPFVGFNRLGFGVPNSWGGHTFTDDEKTNLEAGFDIEVDDCISKKTGSTYACTLSWTEADGIKPTFASR